MEPFRRPAVVVASVITALIALAVIYLLARFWVTTSPVATSTPALSPGASTAATLTPAESVYPPVTTGATSAWPTERHVEQFQGSQPPTPLLMGLRAGTHPAGGFDRIAFDFQQDRPPGYTIEYVDQAVRDASGRTILLSGPVTLRIAFSPATAHTTAGTQPAHPPVNPVVTNYDELQSYVMLGDFEGTTSFGLGLAAKTGYQVHEFRKDGSTWTIYVDVRRP